MSRLPMYTFTILSQISSLSSRLPLCHFPRLQREHHRSPILIDLVIQQPGSASLTGVYKLPPSVRIDVLVGRSHLEGYSLSSTAFKTLLLPTLPSYLCTTPTYSHLSFASYDTSTLYTDQDQYKSCKVTVKSAICKDSLHMHLWQVLQPIGMLVKARFLLR